MWLGQLHIDLFELSELPDMALSNRQGYKSDDPRYEAMLTYVRKKLLPEILRKREIFTDIGKEKKKQQQLDRQKEAEGKLKRSVDNFRKKASRNAAEEVLKLVGELSKQEVEDIFSSAIDENSPVMGL